MITIEDAIKYVSQVIDFCQDKSEYSEFEDDLYSLLDALNDDKAKV